MPRAHFQLILSKIRAKKPYLGITLQIMVIKSSKNVVKMGRFYYCILRRRTDTGAFAGGHSAALADIDFFCLSGYFSFNNDIVVLRYPFKHGVG